MSLKNIWYSVQHSDPGFLGKQCILKLLASAGLLLDPLVRKAYPEGPGLIFFDRVSSGLCELIHGVTNNGLNRVLAVSVGPANNSIDMWILLEAGASDVLKWEDRPESAHEIRLRFERWAEVDALLESFSVVENMIGESLIWKKTLRLIVEIANFTDTSVLIAGETGTGKELAARLIHSLDNRPNKGDFVVLDCTTIVASLAGSEFFGHERGAFTGAVSSRDGVFALANGGTLFLDEIGELSIDLQAQLLRVIQEHTYRRVGGDQWYYTDFRLVCATNRSLQAMVREGKFRSDLYYRLAAWFCLLPTLRERKEDIIPLALYFIRKIQSKPKTVRIDREVEEYLLTRDYPGNVRELKQLISRMMNRLGENGRLTIGMIPEEERPIVDGRPVSWCDQHFERTIHQAVMLGVGLKEIGKMAEDIAVRLAVREENGNLQKAASKLGVSDRTVQKKQADRKKNGPAGEDQPPL